MKTKDQTLLEEAYESLRGTEEQKLKSYYSLQPRSYDSMDSETQKLLDTIARNFNIPNLVSDPSVRDAMAAAYQFGYADGEKENREYWN